MNGLALVRSTADPAFCTDRDGIIRAWNAAAEEAFGLTAVEACGQPCWRILRGRDDYGNDYCSDTCPLRDMALAGKPVHPCQLSFAGALGGLRTFLVTILLLAGAEPADPKVVHLLREVYREAPAESDEQAPLGPNRARGELTGREREVLRLLVQGASTREIAESLRISVHTARNHTQHILHKLHVHSRLEAVAVARRIGLQ